MAMGRAHVSTQRSVAGRYRLVEITHRETNRVCWYADDLQTGRPCLVTRTGLPQDPDDTARRAPSRVLRTTENVARLCPGRVGTLVDAVDEDGHLWIVTAWIDGTPLGEVLAEQGTLNYVRAARIALELLDVLDAAHAAGITHGELSPGQVFVPAGGPVVVTGYGLAGATPAARLTAPSYASPEQARDERTGPAADLWALGALLFRAVQGHAPYPEESTAELVQMVCAEPPAFAEECGPLRPVVESLLRQDPTERPDFEELRGWLRSLVRSAPEPEAGVHVIAAPPVDTNRLPIVRRRGELVRRRRAGLPAHHGRHKRAKQEAGSPRRLGRTLLLLVLLAMAAAIAYAMLFMPGAGEETAGTGATDRTGTAGEVSEAPRTPDGGGAAQDDEPSSGPKESADGDAGESAGSTETQTTGPEVADGFTLRKDPEGFRVAVAEGWERTPKNGSGQVVYSRGDFELIVVPGRDSAERYGGDPMAYQRDDERELQPYRDSSWATSTGLKTIEVGGRTMAEGQFTWTGGAGELYVRNLAALIDGRYHVVQVRGPEADRDEVTRLYEQAATTYRFTG
ncbi:serine/threonine-protein kinase [Streptomyces sp. G35A]